MNARLRQLWDSIFASYWFFPSIMAVAAVLLALGLVAVDEVVGDDWIQDLDWLNRNRPEGARDVLSTIASSMITVAGVVFSVTVAAVVYASGQHGPRLLTNFMRDRGNQLTLGVFIATFLYCLLVLRTVRSPDESDGFGFVPHIALFVGLFLALCSIGVLVYFIHHVPQAIHINNVVADIGRELRNKVRDAFPARLGRGHDEDRDPEDAEPDDFAERATRIEADGSGYVQAVDEDTFFDIARKSDLVIRLHSSPGSFVRPGKTLVEAYPEERVDDDVRRRIRHAFAWGPMRTPAQDFMFLVNELVEIAARALSPGVNDPFTAVNCLDWIADGVAAHAACQTPERFRYDEAGALRVITPVVSFEAFVEAGFGQLRPYAAADRIAALRVMSVLGDLSEAVTEDAHRAVLRAQANALLETAETLMTDVATLEELRRRHRSVVHLLRDEVREGAAAREADWLAQGE